MKDKNLAFLIGLLASSNIFYIFRLNTFCLWFDIVVSLIIFFKILFKKKLSYCLSKTSKLFNFFALFCFLSLIPCLIYNIDRLDFVMSCVYGLIELIIIYIYYLAIIYLKNEEEYITNGILIGLILNILYSIIQYVGFNSSKVISFAYLFPNSSFQISGVYDVLYYDSIQTTLKIYFYRASGFFLETSYFFIYCIGALFVIKRTPKVAKSNLLYSILVLATVILMFMSKTENLVIFLIIYTIYLICDKFIEKKGLKIRKDTLLKFSILVITFVLSLGLFKEFRNLINTSVSNGIEYLSNITFNDQSSNARFKSINDGLDLFLTHPFGIGYNTSAKTINLMYNDVSIFSTFMSLLVEIGIVGSTFYWLFPLKSVFLLFKSKKKKNIILGFATLSLIILQITNGISISKLHFIMLVYCLADINARKLNINE